VGLDIGFCRYRVAKKFFNNLEEVKKVIHAEARWSNPLSGSMKNMGFDCINLNPFKSDG
jgi:hypothetical protein